MRINLLQYLEKISDSPQDVDLPHLVTAESTQKHFANFAAALKTVKHDLQPIRESKIKPQSLTILFNTALPLFNNSLASLAKEFEIDKARLSNVSLHKEKPNVLPAKFYSRLTKYLLIPFPAIKAALEGSFSLFNRPPIGVSFQRSGDGNVSLALRENALHELLVKSRKSSPNDSEAQKFLFEVEKCWKSSE